MDFWFEDQEQSGDGDAFPLLPVEILSMDDNSIQLYRKALHAGMEKIYNIRVMVVGQFGAGKTTLIKRLLGQPVDISERKSTEGIDVHKHCCKISLDKGEWIQQVEDSDQLHILNRLIKLLPVPDQKPDISQEQEGNSEIDATKSNVPSITSVSDQEVQSSTQVSITRGNEIHHVEHLDKETDILAVPLSDAKASESEKKTNDAMMEIIRLVNENAGKLVNDIEKYAAFSIWDFAGQFAFYTTHQMFLTSRAIYLLVIDLSQQITDDIKDDDKCFLDADGIVPRKVFDLFQIWLNSIHSIVKSPEDIVPVIVVGTHVDKIPEKSQKEFIDKYFIELRYMLSEKPTIRHLMDDIAIDNTQPDPMLEELKKRIFGLARQQPHWGEEKPARWLPLEQAIMTLKASGVKIVPLGLIEEINMSGSVKIEDRKELELFLKFHHDIGTILHFSVEELRENIVLDPQWMIDALRSLITAETFIKKYPAITRIFYEFIETGKLSHELIDVIWSKENNLEFHNHKDHILRLMEQLNIIAKPRIFSEEGKETREEHYFLAPCMLQQKTPEEIVSPRPNSLIESSPVLCYVFTGNFLPSAIFHRLVAACIAHWPVAKKKKEHREENLIFCGCCVFELKEKHKLTIHFRGHVIFLRVTRMGMGIKDKTPSSKLCIEVRKFITRNLKKIIGYLGKGLKFEYFIQCPDYNGVSINSLIPVSRLKEEAEVFCEFDEHMIESCKVLDFWFEDQEQSGDNTLDNKKHDFVLTGNPLEAFRPVDVLLAIISDKSIETILQMTTSLQESEIPDIEIRNVSTHLQHIHEESLTQSERRKEDIFKTLFDSCKNDLLNILETGEHSDDILRSALQYILPINDPSATAAILNVAGANLKSKLNNPDCEVWGGLDVRIDSKYRVSLVCVHRGNLNTQLDSHLGLPVMYREYDRIEREPFDASFSDEYHTSISPENLRRANILINKHGDELFKRHSNLVAVSPSSVLSSKSRGLKIEPSIVLYCRMKGVIPIEENHFPKKLGLEGIILPTDIREGLFTFVMHEQAQHTFFRPIDRNDKLRMGCSIGLENSNNSGTLGPFVRLGSDVGFITCAHFIGLDKRSVVNETVVQPGNGDSDETETACGEVLDVYFDDNDKSVDAALIKVNNRDVAPTEFTWFNPNQVLDAGFDLAKPPSFLGGSVRMDTDFSDAQGKRVIKCGKATGLTKGSLALNGIMIRIEDCPFRFPARVTWNELSAVVMKNQYLVENNRYPFCSSGDSGAGVYLVENKQNNLSLIGIIIGLLNEYTVVTPIRPVLESLQLKPENVIADDLVKVTAEIHKSSRSYCTLQ